MKNNLRKSLALLLCATMLAGCNQSTDTKDISTNSAREDISLVDSLKAKYGEEADYNYAEPMYNLEKNHIFTYENLPDQYFRQSAYDCFKVFYDSALTRSVSISIDSSYSDKKVTISPSSTFSYNEDAANGTWGSQTKFWLVQYVDLETGEMLETPLITVFTTKEELSAPTLNQTVGTDGLYSLSWNAIEGADYYEVYKYNATGSGCCELEVTTTNTSCTYNDFASQIKHEKELKELIAKDQIDSDDTVIINGQVCQGSNLELVNDNVYSINSLLSIESSFFVVARCNDEKGSGMSNICEVSQLANQLPCTVSQDFKTEYEGNTISELPAYAKVEMVDGTTGEFLIQYHKASVTLLSDGSISIQTRFKNLPIYLPRMLFKGMDYNTFLGEQEIVTQREDNLATKSVTGNEDVNIQFAPTDTTASGKDTTAPKETGGFNLDEELTKSVYATSALSEWIALNMLSGESDIYLGDFPESADSENISSALLEAYIQNPLIGIMDTADYDYKTKTLQVSYLMGKKDMKNMQKESLTKAKEIVSSIIKEGMTDFEKEEAINRYLCENVTYNEKIYDYIKDDGTIDNNAVTEFSNSFTPYGALLENEGVCESYAEAFLLLAREAGLEAIIVTGSMEGVNHEWNRVKLDNSWYSLDVTNNDSELVPNGYFNLSDKLAANYLKEDGRFLANTKVEWLQAADNQYEYYTKNQWVASEDETATELLANMLSNQDQAAIRLEGTFDNSSIESIAQKVCDKGNMTNMKYYYRAGVLAMKKSLE